jgi:hypothetical protein
VLEHGGDVGRVGTTRRERGVALEAQHRGHAKLRNEVRVLSKLIY